MKDFTQQVLDIIKSIPPGQVMTYGQIAAIAGDPRGARQVARILHGMSEAHQLPWHRVINAKGGISLRGELGVMQADLLRKEGVEVNRKQVDLVRYRARFE